MFVKKSVSFDFMLDSTVQVAGGYVNSTLHKILLLNLRPPAHIHNSIVTTLYITKRAYIYTHNVLKRTGFYLCITHI